MTLVQLKVSPAFLDVELFPLFIAAAIGLITFLAERYISYVFH